MLLNDREIAGPSVFVPPEQRSIGLVFQDFALFPHLSILDNVRFGLTALSREEARREAMIALERVGLQSYAVVLSARPVRRRAAARGAGPRAGAAAGRAADGRAVLRARFPAEGFRARRNAGILRQSRATAIVVTHDAEEAMRMGDRIALLKDGRLKQSGRAEELYLRPADLFVAGFFSELNVFEDARQRRRRRDAGRQGRDRPSPTARRSMSRSALRASTSARHAGVVEARILSRRYLGVVELLELAVSGAETPVRARVRCGALSAAARDIWLSLSKSDVLVFERQSKSA